MKNEVSINLIHDPAAEGVTVLVAGMGANGGRTELITLDPSKWKTLGQASSPKGYLYRDKAGSQGGITKVLLKQGKLILSAKGANWSWVPAGPQDEVWIYLSIEEETYCARFGGSIKRNQAGLFKANDAVSPGVCPAQVCGNGVVELNRLSGCDARARRARR